MRRDGHLNTLLMSAVKVRSLWSLIAWLIAVAALCFGQGVKALRRWRRSRR